MTYKGLRKTERKLRNFEGDAKYITKANSQIVSTQRNSLNLLCVSYHAGKNTCIVDVGPSSANNTNGLRVEENWGTYDLSVCKIEFS